MMVENQSKRKEDNEKMAEFSGEREENHRKWEVEDICKIKESNSLSGNNMVKILASFQKRK